MHSGGRPPGAQNKIVEAIKKKSISFFERILDDETEAKFWRYFMTGYVVESITNSEGQITNCQIVPIPLNPVAWNAFKRAVEYKRGMPVQAIIASGDLQIRVEYLA